MLAVSLIYVPPLRAARDWFQRDEKRKLAAPAGFAFHPDLAAHRLAVGAGRWPVPDPCLRLTRCRAGGRNHRRFPGDTPAGIPGPVSATLTLTALGTWCDCRRRSPLTRGLARAAAFPHVRLGMQPDSAALGCILAKHFPEDWRSRAGSLAASKANGSQLVVSQKIQAPGRAPEIAPTKAGKLPRGRRSCRLPHTACAVRRFRAR